MGLNYLPSPAIIQQFFWPIMTLIICVQTYKKFGLVAKIGVGTFVCLIYIQNVKYIISNWESNPLSVHCTSTSTYLHTYYTDKWSVPREVPTCLVFTRHFLNMNKIQVGRLLQVFYNNLHVSLIYIHSFWLKQG